MKATANKRQLIADLGRQFSDITILMHEAIARDCGLIGTDHKYLGYILKKGTMTAGELSEITGLTTGAVTGLIDRLEKKELVKRVFDMTDRRKVMVEPNSEKAAQLLDGTFSELQSITNRLLSTFSDKELQVIEKYMLSAMKLMQEFTINLKNRH